MISDKTMMMLSALSLIAIVSIVAISVFVTESKKVKAEEEDNLAGEAFGLPAGYELVTSTILPVATCTDLGDLDDPYRAGGLLYQPEYEREVFGETQFVAKDECIDSHYLYEVYCDASDMVRDVLFCEGGCTYDQCSRFIYG